MADSFFTSFAKSGAPAGHDQHPFQETDPTGDAVSGGSASSTAWPACAPGFGQRSPPATAAYWFDDPLLIRMARGFSAWAKMDSLQQHGVIMNSISPQSDTVVGPPAQQSAAQQVAHKVMHFLAVGAPPVFIAFLTPWVWLDWSFSLYLETAGSVLAGLGAATAVTSGFLARKRRLALAEKRYASLTPEQQGRAVSIDQALDRLEQRGRQAGDAEIRSHILRITQSIRAVLPVLVADKGGDAELFYTVRQTALDYLPSTLDAYQRIPPAAINHPDVAEQAPRQLLLEQLQLIERNIQQLTGQLTESGRQALQANGRFLQERFRAPGGTLSAPPSPPAE